MKYTEAIAKFLKFQEFIQSASPHTLKAYGKDLGQAFDPCKNSNVTAESLLKNSREALMAWASLSPASRNRKASSLKSFSHYLFQEEILRIDLAPQIHLPKVPRKIPNFLSVDEVTACLDSFLKQKQTETSNFERILFLLLYGGGLRVSEACQIRWKDFLFSKKSLRVLGKGQKERIVILPSIVIELLQRQKKNSEFVFGEIALNPRTAYEWIRRRGVQAGLIRPLHPHALRHSFSTHLLTSGVNLRTLQELLGHESLTATEKYTHLGIDQLARTLEKHHPFGEKKP